MKKIAAFIILILVCSFQTFVFAAESDEYYFKTAIGLLDLSKPELSAVKSAASSGDYEKAVEEYKSIFFTRAKEYADKGYLKSTPSAEIGKADDLLQNYVNINDDSGTTRRLYMGETGAWNWFYDDNAWATYGTRMQWMKTLVDCYIVNDNIEYLEKYLSIFEDFDTNYINQYNEYNKRTDLLAGVNIQFTRVGQLYNDFRLNRRFYSIMDCLRYKPEDIISLYNNVRFAKMLIGANEDAVKLHLTRQTPNHFEIAMRGFIRSYPFLIDMPSYIKHYEDAQVVMQEHIAENILPDGGAPEMALHYNYEFVTTVTSLEEPFQIIGEEPEWFKNAKEQAKYRVRMLASVIMPDGTNPNLAEDYTGWDVWGELNRVSKGLGGVDVADTYNARFNEGKDVKPAFTSVAFPFVGYYVMRNNWDRDSQYLFFTGSRFGAGHVEMNRLEVKYAAYGERLLGSSPASYSYVDHAKYNNYMYSSVGNNTVRVDDYSQKRTIKAYSDFSTPEKGIWHSSNNFDYAEAAYTGGYNTFIGTWDERKGVLVADTVHNRGVIMDKENTLAVVTDVMNSAGKHTYQMAWNFEEKFNKYDTVAANAEEKWIKSCLDDGKAGVEIYNMYDGDLSYNIRCGEVSETEAVGWWLHQYGTDFKSAVHTDTVFNGDGKTTIATLINPTYNGASNIKSLERNDYGFTAEMVHGNKVTYQTGKKNRNFIEAGEIEFDGKSIYLVERPDGSAWGMLLNPLNVKYNGKSMPEINESVEFEIVGGVLKVVSQMKAPTTFKWQETANGVVPSYGYADETRFEYR